MKHLVALLLVALAATTYIGVARADGGVCLTREQAISLIAHKADVERGGHSVSKWRLWEIADRESGLNHCWPNGRVKVSATGDHGLIQMNPWGVWTNCLVNPWCRRPDLIDDPEYQLDVMFNYYDLYGDLCPWNPDQVHPNYMPGCGYR